MGSALAPHAKARDAESSKMMRQGRENEELMAWQRLRNRDIGSLARIAIGQRGLLVGGKAGLVALRSFALFVARLRLVDERGVGEQIHGRQREHLGRHHHALATD